MAEWFEKITVGSLPQRAAARFGDREALMFKGRRWSFAQVAQRVDEAAKALMALGVKPGDKVTLWLPNRPEFIDIFFGLAKIGAVVVPLNTSLRTADTAYMLKQSDSATLITVDQSGPIDYLEMVQKMLPTFEDGQGREISDPDFPVLEKVVILSETRYERTYSWLDLLEEGRSISDETLTQRADAVDPDSTMLIMYTSGTTGFPKGAMHCHNFVRNIMDEANRMAMTIQDVIIMYLPLFHVFGLYEGPLISFVSGARMVLTERFDPAEALELIEQEQVTLIHGFDTHYKDLIEAFEKKPVKVDTLRTGLFAAGMSSSVAVGRKAMQVLCPGLLSAFGMSEIGVGACLSFLTSTEEQRSEASGYPSPGYEIKIVDPKTGQEQPTGTPGEILIRAYMVMQGYYNKPEETAKTIDSNGWLHTGDMGVMREDGHLRFIGRFKEMIKTGGENVDPMEVEAFLLNHPAVNQIAIVGYPDERLSEVGAAFICLEPGHSLTREELTDFCKGEIATFKIPRHLIFVQDYPMTASGKIQKVKLMEMAIEQLG